MTDARTEGNSGNQQPLLKIEPPFYPIVYVRGYAMTPSEREDVFHDAYYGFGVSSVEKRQAPPPKFFEADLFEGLLIRLIKDHKYLDATNRGLDDEGTNPSRSIWVSRFYDLDFLRESGRDIVDHATDLCTLLTTEIPDRLKKLGVDTSNYKVILIAHSMGGLVCRTLIQKLLPEKGIDPASIVHRLVTMGTPHRGIDLGSIPDLIENWVVDTWNPYNAGIFKYDRMRSYLNLQDKVGDQHRYDVHSLGDRDRFPVKRCLCIIGSDWQAYGAVRKATGGVSDGLVKQSRAYIVAGDRPSATARQDDGDDYSDDSRAFWANVHRAHSGYRGIVNSYESYENIQRFLFGDTMVRLDLEDIEFRTQRQPGNTYFYDIEFLLAIRGTATYLHRRQQDPCENAIRIKIEGDAEPPKKPIFLHTGFMNTKLRKSKDPFSYFRLGFQVTESRVESGLLWDRDYPSSAIYNETMEARVGDGVEYRWLADIADQVRGGWKKAKFEGDQVRIPLRSAKSFAGTLVVRPGPWPNPELTKD